MRHLPETQSMKCRQCETTNPLVYTEPNNGSCLCLDCGEKNNDPDLVGALRKLLAYANKYSDSMKEHRLGASELGENADSTSVAALARIAINREEQWQHLDRMQQRIMATKTTREEYFSQPEKEQNEFYRWMLVQCGDMRI